MKVNHVVTYYDPVENLWTHESQIKLIDVWRRSWEKAGWTATVLSQGNVKCHPRFHFFNDHCQAKPTEYPRVYTVACFMRWLAAAHFGNQHGRDVMMTDYDVINYGFPPQEIENDEMTIFKDSPPPRLFMGSVLGSPQHFTDIMELFVAAKPCELDFIPRINMHHQDDLSLLLRMFETDSISKPDWLVVKPGCGLFPHPSWQTSPLVHYGYMMREAGYWPKCDHIEKIRPF
jgi:hypothetical protein